MSDQKIPEAQATLSDPEQVRTLRAALTVVRTRQADEDDLAEDQRDLERDRLELLAEKVRPLLDEVDPRDERFDLVLATGSRPRLWIDMTSFVAMGPDRDGNPKRGYRLLRDTRLGRVVVAESADLDKAADAVAAYMAERIVDREKMIEGDWLADSARRHAGDRPANSMSKGDVLPPEAEGDAGSATVSAAGQLARRRPLHWFASIVLGVLAGIGAAAIAFYLTVDSAL